MTALVTDLRQIVETERQRFAVPGCAVVVVADGEVVLCDGFGDRDVDRDLPVTPRTLFPIASSTKTFTAALCALLVDDDLLSWHRPVREYLPELRMVDPVATEQLTVRDLLCHRSGLPRHDMLWYAAASEGMSRADLLAALAHLAPSRGFREAWQYNNLLYMAAGQVAGRVTGGSYEDALRGRILEPLGMARTNLSVEWTGADPDAARPYVVPEPGAPLQEVPFAPLDLIAPAGALNSCAADLVPWLMTLLGHGVEGRPALLSPHLLTALRTPAMPLPERSLLAGGDPVGYGLGQIVEDYRGHRSVHHGGNIDGFSSQVSVIPAAGCAVAVLTNRDGTALRDALPYLIYDRLLGLDPRPHGQRLLALEEALHQGRAQSRRRTATHAADLPALRPAHDYVGGYRHPGYGDLVVTAAGDGLYARYRGIAGSLDHRHLDVFTLVADLGGVSTPLPVQFFHDIDGDVTAAELALDTGAGPVRFDRLPDSANLTDELLDTLAGTYRRGPLEMTVERHGPTGLVAVLLEGPPATLEHRHDLIFTAGGTRIEFTDDGRLVTASGEYTRTG